MSYEQYNPIGKCFSSHITIDTLFLAKVQSNLVDNVILKLSKTTIDISFIGIQISPSDVFNTKLSNFNLTSTSFSISTTLNAILYSPYKKRAPKGAL